MSERDAYQFLLKAWSGKPSDAHLENGRGDVLARRVNVVNLVSEQGSTWSYACRETSLDLNIIPDSVKIVMQSHDFMGLPNFDNGCWLSYGGKKLEVRISSVVYRDDSPVITSVDGSRHYFANGPKSVEIEAIIPFYPGSPMLELLPASVAPDDDPPSSQDEGFESRFELLEFD